MSRSAVPAQRVLPHFRPVIFLVGGILAALGATMLLPAAADLIAGHPDWKAFAVSSVITMAAGCGIAFGARSSIRGGLTLRQAFLLTPVAWVTVSAFAAIPFLLSRFEPLGRDYTNAFFEAMSGLTTTGSTIIVGLDSAPHGILLWRALLQWMGGIGIIATAIAILPTLRVGGMQLFRTESSDRSEKVLPRAQQVAAAIVWVYVGLTVLCGISYWIAGLTPFESVAHALATVATGGFSTSDLSLARWQSPAVHWIAVVFMLAGAIPFVLFVRAVRGERDVLRDRQVRTMLIFLLIVIAGLAVWLNATGRYDPTDAVRHAAFNVVSVVTTTGFASTDYTLWGNVATGVFFGLTFVGGCTGSTSGGIKIFRFEVMAIMLRAHFLHLLYPKGVFPRVYGHRDLPDDVVGSVVVFFALFFLSYGLLTIALMAFELDFLTSASAAVTALSNVGPGLGRLIGPVGSFASLPDGVKWLLSFAMLLGRLELFTVLILFMPRFWRG